VALLGGLITTIIGLRLFPLLPKEISWQANLIVGVGLTFFILGAALLYGFNFPPRLGYWLDTVAERVQITHTQGIFLFFALLFSCAASLAAGAGGLMRSKGLGIGCWVAALAFLVLGAWWQDESFSKPSWKTLAVALGLFILSTVIRTIVNQSVPPLLNGDEASAGLSAVSFLEQKENNIFGVSWFSFPSLYFYLQSFSIRLFGQTTFAIRFPSAVIGGLTVSAVYLVGRRMFSPRAGLAAGIFLLGSHFHHHFSRIALNNIYDAFWYIITLGMLWDGWENQRRSSFLIAGFGFGMAQYFYASSRFLLGIIPIWLITAVIFQRRKLVGNRTNILILLSAFVVVVLPLGMFYLEKPDDFAAPFNRVETLGDWLSNEIVLQALPAWKIIANQIITSAKTYISMPSEVWYRPQVPILRPISAGLFIAGMILLLFRLRRASAAMLFLWIGSFVMIGGLSIPVSAAQRYVAALPACALVIGFALDESANLLEKVWQEWRKLLNAAVFLIITVICLDDLYFYLFTYTPVSDLGGLNTLVAQRLAEYLQDEEDIQVAFFGQPRMGYYSINSTAYLAPHIQGLDFNHPWGSPDNPEITADEVLFVFLPDNQENLDLVKQDYPNGNIIIQLNDDGSTLYWMYTAQRSISE
jgi:4-amino-4-deoxy-L-arabinose transferase-like glycosyltransferase